MTKLLMVASEATPFAKTGGLADVVGALSATLRAQGEEVAIVMPRYQGISVRGLPCVYDDLRVWFSPSSFYVARIFRALERDVPYYFVDCPPLYEREGLYGDSEGDYPDNYLRFAVFSRAVLNLARHVFRPQVIHCHDWQTALVPVYMRTLFANDPTFLGIGTLLTIHNLGYQGVFPAGILKEIGLDESMFEAGKGIEAAGQTNLLKGGLLYAGALSTVSAGYAREIQTPELGFGLDDILRARSESLSGIVNGVDYTQWDPATDPNLAVNYSPGNLAGKRIAKADLLREFGLSPERIDAPLIGIVSRFAGQKGFDLIEEAAAELMAEDLSLVALGTGEPRYEQMFTDLAAAYPDKVAVRVGFDEALAHRIEAGADMFLMPSLYEPCGLNQIYSLRYGTIPVVRATGGLDDTVDAETGFKFREYSPAALVEAVRAALAAYRKPDLWKSMMETGMRRDFSWKASAAEYAAVYRRLAV